MSRLTNIFVVIFALMLISACSTTNSYDETFSHLSNENKVSSALIYIPVWIPIDSHIDYSVSEKEQGKAAFDLEACSKKLRSMKRSGNRSAKPEIRVLQITECMNEKGWRIRVNETGIVS